MRHVEAAPGGVMPRHVRRFYQPDSAALMIGCESPACDENARWVVNGQHYLCRVCLGALPAVSDAEVTRSVGAGGSDAPRAGDAAGVDLVPAHDAVVALAVRDPREVPAEVAHGDAGRPSVDEVMARVELARRRLDGVAGFDRVAASIGAGVTGDDLRGLATYGVAGFLALLAGVDSARRHRAAAGDPDPDPHEHENAHAVIVAEPAPPINFDVCTRCHGAIDVRKSVVIHRRGWSHPRCWR